MKFENIFKKSYNEYKINFKTIFLLSLIFIGIPLVLSSLFSVFYIARNPDFYKMIIINNNFDFMPIGFLASMIFVGLISFIFYFIFDAGLIKESINGKINFHKTINSGKNNFWKIFWFSIVITFFLGLLFLALIIPGIIFGIYWILAVFIYFENKKTVIESLKTSFHMVKGNWWRIFGYFILIFLFSLIVLIVVGIINLPIVILIYKLEDPSTILLIWDSILSNISSFLSNLIIIPFSIIFYKNVYLELKNKKNK